MLLSSMLFEPASLVDGGITAVLAGVIALLWKTSNRRQDDAEKTHQDFCKAHEAFVDRTEKKEEQMHKELNRLSFEVGILSGENNLAKQVMPKLEEMHQDIKSFRKE